MDASYEIYPDASIVAYHVTGNAYEAAQSREYDRRGGYPVSRHKTAKAAIRRRAELGAQWFGLDNLTIILPVDIEEVV